MNPQFLAGARRSVPILFSAAPFGVLFGAVAIDNGLTVTQAVVMSLTVYAGASQMVGIELFGHHAAPWLIAFSIFVVNARHVLYSATIGRHFANFTNLQKSLAFFFLIDPQFAESEREIDRTGKIDFQWYLGMALSFYSMWFCATLIGAQFGKILPDAHTWGIDFLLSIYFLGLVMGFRKRPLWLPVVLVSGAASIFFYKTIGSPWHVSLGALAGIAYAAIFGASEAKP